MNDDVDVDDVDDDLLNTFGTRTNQTSSASTSLCCLV